LRNGHTDIELSDVDHRALCVEVDFYQLELLDVLNAPLDDSWTLTETPNGELSNGGLTLTCTKEYFAASRGTIGWTRGVHEWVVRIEVNGGFVGISEESIDPVDDNNRISCTLDCDD
jgi:hypothetical protein